MKDVPEDWLKQKIKSIALPYDPAILVLGISDPKFKMANTKRCLPAHLCPHAVH